MKKKLLENKVAGKAVKIMNRVEKKAYLLYISFCSMLIEMRLNGAWAGSDLDGKSLANTAISWITTLAFLPAAFYVITGILKYGEAHSESDGPAEKKAKKEIMAGIMIALVAVAAKAFDISKYLNLEKLS